MKARSWKDIDWKRCARDLATLQNLLAIAGNEKNAQQVAHL